MRKYFNTSGPNIPSEHYTLMRESLLAKGITLVNKRRYFTIWAPRQTGKSTYFRLLAQALNERGYHPVFFSTEGYNDYRVEDVFDSLVRELQNQQNIITSIKTFKDFEKFISENREFQCVLIIDEIEGLNPKIFNQFLHTIRNLYHSRDEHCLKSVILVGVSNIVGIIQDNASPFNITDNLPIPYFTEQEVYDLLEMHETDTGQLFDEKVKSKISYITAGQPGLVNAFAYKLVEDNPDKKLITYEDYLKVERWYLTEVIDKNISNVINKAKPFRPFVEKLLFDEENAKFDIEREAI